MKQHPQSILLAVLCIGLTACASHRLHVVPAPIKAPAPAPVAIGKVSLVNSGLGFVLIQSREIPAAGTALQSRAIDGKQSADLKVSPQQNPPFIIAEIVKGKPQVGEVVTK